MTTKSSDFETSEDWNLRMNLNPIGRVRQEKPKRAEEEIAEEIESKTNPRDTDPDVKCERCIFYSFR